MAEDCSAFRRRLLTIRSVLSQAAPTIRTIAHKRRCPPDDMSQEVAVSCLSNAAIDWSQPQTGLIIHIAQRRCYDYIRHKSRHENALSTLTRRFVSTQAEGDPLITAAAREQQGRVESAVSQLPPAYRDVIHRKYHLGQSDLEIANALGVPRPTVRTRLNRAISRIRLLLRSQVIRQTN